MITENYRLHKFGGSSLMNQHCFENVKKLLTTQHEIIVVSAIKGITSQLQNLLDLAKNGADFISETFSIKKQHENLAQSLLTSLQSKNYVIALEQDLSNINNLLDSIKFVKEYSKEMQDLVLGYGEQWSAKLLTLYLSNYCKALYLDATSVLFVKRLKNGAIQINWEKSQAALNQFLQGKNFERLVITGFIAVTEEGRRTILGRNGSDFSAAIFAKLFNTKNFTIWTDVDGIYSADPSKVRSAFPIEMLSYAEAFELAYFGAKVIHPNTVMPAVENEISIYIKNSFNPAAPGTCITSLAPQTNHPVRGISSIDDIALITVEGPGMFGISSVVAQVFQLLHQNNIVVILVTQASSEHSICFAVHKTQANLAFITLQNHFQFDLSQKVIEKITVDEECAILAVVGEGMVGTPGITNRLGSNLSKANISIRAIAQGSSERNISVVVKNQDIIKALRAVHAGFYLSPRTISIGLIGCGQVGKAFLRQIQENLQQLKAHYQVNLCVRGIMNSKKMLLTHDAIDLKNWQKLFESTNTAATIEEFSDHILSDEIPQAVLIDCTASQVTTDNYLSFIEKGAHIVTPNKRANSGDLHFYKKLKSLALQKNRFYLYETTVCAGLPVIKTLQDFIQTGDEVIAIEGIVSGTLGYIFNELDKGKTFSSAVNAARELGFTEPDPRDDLSGMDIARKVVCLARELGLNTTLDDVKVHDLVPHKLKNVNVAEFLNKLPEYDDAMNAVVTKAIAKNEKISYIATIQKNGKISVDMQSFAQSHPFSQLQGTDNMLIFRTKRYNQQPLIIRGPGAGPEVTAAGVFADLLRLVSSLS